MRKCNTYNPFPLSVPHVFSGGHFERGHLQARPHSARTTEFLLLVSSSHHTLCMPHGQDSHPLFYPPPNTIYVLRIQCQTSYAQPTPAFQQAHLFVTHWLGGPKATRPICCIQAYLLLSRNWGSRRTKKNWKSSFKREPTEKVTTNFLEQIKKKKRE